ncbi:MAG TPA: N-acetyltransferase [Micromonospora sp.]
MTTLRLRPERAADAPAIRRVIAEAFARPDATVPAEVSLVDRLRHTEAWLPELSMLAEAGLELVGYALLSRVWVEPGRYPALVLGPVAVAPRRHGQGVGTAVVQAALYAAAELGERLVLVLGNPAWYRRFGFVPAARFGLTSPWSGLGDPWQALVLPSGSGTPSPTGSARSSPPAGEVVFPSPWSLV